MSASAAQIVKNWQAAMSSGTAQQKYRDAISNVQSNPMEAAAAAVDSGAYLQGVQAAVASGKMAKKLRGASFANWKTITSTVGASNLQSGAQKGLSKMQAAAAQIASAGAAGKAAAAQASGASAKMIANMNAIRNAWGYGGA